MEKKTFKTMTIGEKIEHIWEYYKLVIIGIVAAVAIIIYAIVKAVTPEPDIVMNAVLVNANSYDVQEEDCFQRYLKENGYDLESETINVNTTMYLDNESGSQANATSYQVLVAMIMVGEIDLLIGNEGTIDMMGSGQGLVEIEDILPAEIFEKYKGRLYTVEDTETGETYVCGIWLPEENSLKQDGYYTGEVLAAIPYTAVNMDTAKDVLLYLLGE